MTSKRQQGEQKSITIKAKRGSNKSNKKMLVKKTVNENKVLGNNNNNNNNNSTSSSTSSTSSSPCCLPPSLPLGMAVPLQPPSSSAAFTSTTQMQSFDRARRHSDDSAWKETALW